ADLDIRMRVAAQESTQADDNRRRLELHGAQAEAMAPMAGRRPRLDVAAGILQVAHATIADVAQEIRIVERLDNERRIGVRQWAQSQSRDRKSTRLNSSHSQISYAVFCL